MIIRKQIKKERITFFKNLLKRNLKEKSFKVSDEDEILYFHKAHDYQSNGWEVILKQCRFLNSGYIIFETYNNKNYIVCHLKTGRAILFNLILLILGLVAVKLSFSIGYKTIMVLCVVWIVFLLVLFKAKLKRFLNKITPWDADLTS